MSECLRKYQRHLADQENKKDRFLTSNDLQDLIRKHGKENLLFMVPMRPVRTALGLISYTSSDDDPVIVPATITEGRYKLDANYKIELSCVYPSFGKESFYITDLMSLIRKGQVQVFAKALA